VSGTSQSQGQRGTASRIRIGSATASRSIAEFKPASSSDSLVRPPRLRALFASTTVEPDEWTCSSFRSGRSGWRLSSRSRTLHDLPQRSELPRDAYVRWNIVPWAVYAADGHWRPPTDQDLIEAAPALGELLAALPKLRMVICMGAKALTGSMRHITLTDRSTPPLILGVPHPSQRNTRARRSPDSDRERAAGRRRHRRPVNL